MPTPPPYPGSESIDFPPPGNLLIVDDDPVNRQILRCLLEQAQYRIIEADHGQQGLDRAISDRPDLILLDIMMPDLDGFAVCKALGEDEKTASIPVILVTALNSCHDETRGLEVGSPVSSIPRTGRS